MKILFVHPSARTRFPEPPLGLASLISIALSKKCEIAIYDEDKHSATIDYEKLIEERDTYMELHDRLSE